MNRKTIALNITAFLLLIVGYSFFRSYIDHIEFVIALDNLISVVISELWKFVSSPTIFIVLLVVLIILSFKDNLLMLFPAIKEIKAGSFSAIIDSSQIAKLFSAKSDDLELVKNLDTKKKKEEVVDYLLERLGEAPLLFLLELDGRSLEFPEVLKIAERLHLGEKSLNDEDFRKLDSFSRNLYLVGNLVVLIKVTFPAFFDKKTDDSLGVTRTLKDGVRAKIKERLKMLEQLDKDKAD